MTAVLSFDADNFEDLGGRLELVVADEIGGRGRSRLGELDDLLLLGGAGAGPLLVHQLVEAGDINGQAALAGHQLGEVEREAVGVVELESATASPESHRAERRSNSWLGMPTCISDGALLSVLVEHVLDAPYPASC